MAHAAVKKQRKAVALTCKLAGVAKVPYKRYLIYWYYNRGPAPDPDNVVARLKSTIDGICDYFGINDRNLEISRVSSSKDKIPHMGFVLCDTDGGFMGTYDLWEFIPVAKPRKGKKS